MIKIFFLSFTFICFLFKTSSGQNNDSNQYKFSSDIFNHISKDSAYWRGGVTASDLSFIGLYREALAEYDKPRRNRRTISSSDSAHFLKTYHPVEARTFIIQKAKNSQIIIFNEAHYNPRNRVFVTSLLKALKDAGFKYFAAEAFINDSFFLKTNHPSFETGFYTMEPQFGNLVREAIKENFILSPYEDTTGADGKEREIGEAKNIKMLLKKDPDAKIIIHCGFDHIFEDSLPYWGKAMAGRVKELTGIDPFTVEQVELSERSSEDLESPYYKLIHSNHYSVLVDKNSKAYNNGKVDALLYSPPTKYIYNRPEWVFENGKTPYFLNETSLSISFPILVKAYLDTDNLAKSIPIDIVEIKTRGDLQKTALALTKGDSFIIKISNQSGKMQIIKTRKNNRS